MNNHNQFDIVILVGPNDTNKINLQLPYTKKNIIGYRNIYIVANKQILSIINDKTVILIDEEIYPFTMNDVINIHGKTDRIGWYYQQLLKLYAWSIIDGILDRYLVIDTDTFFMKPTKFIDSSGKCLYAIGTEYVIPYFDHMKRLHPTFKRVFPKLSGICHHMMFETKYIKEIFELVQSNHNGEEFWKLFLSLVDPKKRNGKGASGASEYEIYFNYVFAYHPTSVKIRPLRWINSQFRNLKQNNTYDFISYQWYLG